MLASSIRILFLLFSLVGSAFALDLELTHGVNMALPIGINSFGTNDEAQDMVKVIDNDLKLSGQFNVISSGMWNGEQPLSYWKRVGADSVLSGRVTPIENNQYSVTFELINSADNGKLLLSQKYQVSANRLRSLAHHISDEVYFKLTGDRGVFSTKIAYVLVQRAGENSKYSLEVADMDGYNAHSLLVSASPIMSPSWSPNGRQIAYVSFEKKRSQVYIVDVATGGRRLITDFMGINGAPAWSPDGRELAVVLSKNGSPKIYVVNLANGNMRQVTFGDAIDTEPRYAPDGKTLLFTSGRSGSPQIYSLNLADGRVSRMSFDGNYNARSSYTPNQKFIVMLHREDRDFRIGVQNVATGMTSIITDSDADESPTVSPNGKLVLYATKMRDKGILAISSIDGSIRIRLPSREGDVQEPAWSPFIS